ncbi:MAG: metalloregulator ArsR/SmtB family transcription factor [Patescibacteria group bacterium]
MSTSNLERIFKVLASKRRLAIIQLLSKKEEMSVGDIADTIKLSLKATSKHLIILRQARFIEREQKKFVGLYSMLSDLDNDTRYLLRLIIK